MSGDQAPARVRVFRCTLSCGHELLVENVIGADGPLSVVNKTGGFVACYEGPPSHRAQSVVSYIEVLVDDATGAEVDDPSGPVVVPAEERWDANG